MSGGRHTLATGSHHHPLSQPSGVGEIGARQVAATGSHQPFSQFGTTGAWQRLATGSHHQPFPHEADATAGITPAVNAIGMKAAVATIVARRDFFTASSRYSTCVGGLPDGGPA